VKDAKLELEIIIVNPFSADIKEDSSPVKCNGPTVEFIRLKLPVTPTTKLYQKVLSPLHTDEFVTTTTPLPIGKLHNNNNIHFFFNYNDLFS
jgi:hypothetical protein